MGFVNKTRDSGTCAGRKRARGTSIGWEVYRIQLAIRSGILLGGLHLFLRRAHVLPRGPEGPPPSPGRHVRSQLTDTQRSICRLKRSRPWNLWTGGNFRLRN